MKTRHADRHSSQAQRTEEFELGPQTTEHQKPSMALHVTALEHLSSILTEGLKPQIGPLSQCLETVAAVYLFPTWEAMLDAQWLYESWPYDSEPVLLAVDLRSFEIGPENFASGYEIVLYEGVPAGAITVLQHHERDWSSKLQDFLEMGGRKSDIESPEPDSTRSTAGLK